MNKNDVVNSVYENMGKEYPKKDIAKLLNACFAVVKSATKHKESVSFAGFGKFRHYETKERKGVNTDGVAIVIPSRETMKFSASDIVFD